MKDDVAKMTAAEAQAEVRRLRSALLNVHRCLQAASVSLRNAGLPAYPGRDERAGAP